MASSVPPSFSFEMLSRLPANSFVLNWKEIRPDQAPSGNGSYPLGVRNKIRFNIRGAPNEFVLNTNMYLCGSAVLKVRQSNYLNTANDVTLTEIGDWASKYGAFLNDPYHYFQSSRESFNAGSLPFLDNQDPQRSHEINNLRMIMARRNRNDTKSKLFDLSTCFSSPQNSLVSGGSDTGIENIRGVRVQYKTPDAGVTEVVTFGGNKTFQIPLGLYSNFVNSHSILPVGLTSSYAVNGWQIELETSEQTTNDGRCWYASNLKETGGEIDVATGEINDLRLFVPYIRLLDESVMEAVLSLYEKREMVAVGGVQFPLSLRINSLGYRFSSFPLVPSQKDYFFRIAGTDRSVRAYAWWIYKKANKGGSVLNAGENLQVTRLETHIGNESPHEVIEDTSAKTNNINNFVCVNAKRSASMFSPLPYYEEGRKFDGMQDDDLVNFNNTLTNNLIPNTTYLKALATSSVCYGIVSLENLDRREGDYSGGFQASGKDLTNVGAIDVRMRIVKPSGPPDVVVNGTGEKPPASALDNWDTSKAITADDYEIIFCYSFDSVMEISPSGVQDVTNAVL